MVETNKQRKSDAGQTFAVLQVAHSSELQLLQNAGPMVKEPGVDGLKQGDELVPFLNGDGSGNGNVAGGEEEAKPAGCPC